MSDRVVSVSVDLDPVECYWRIHAMPGAPPERARHAILRRCLPRFAELFARHGVRATFFVVARDLDEDVEGRALLAALARDGHELASHTYSHPYDLVRLPATAIAAEIDRAHGLIGACGGAAPRGFRAPGYAVSSELIEMLRARSYRYDSSAFPSLAYYGAKAAVLGAMRLVGRKSGSILDTPRVLAAPRAPYRPAPGAPYRAAAGKSGDAGANDLVELPMTVTPLARLPVFGTSLVTAPGWMRRHLIAVALRAPFFNLELHGIDLADADADEIPPALVARQPDLRRPLAHKLAALDETLTAARAAGARFARLDEVASTFTA
ncbi:MAG TPA: polysaccharide deacetylase family protein [Polyangia bacterium]|jgi:peptidoglycan/xylan/chitin deacetylase (PgdA/CDA1 family)|nr:polysaccharide deacetylase family protein [Polyangia bacterium]